MAGSSRGLRVLILVLAIIGGVVVVGCLGLVGLGLWGFSELTNQAMAALNDNPVVQQHVGEITEMDVDWTGTGSEEEDNVFVYTFTGTRASGVVTAEFITVDTNTEKVVSGTIELSSGDAYDLFPEEETSPD